MRWKIFSLLFTLLVILMLAIYWFIPMKSVEFSMKPKNYNFSLNNSELVEMQFYPNMRYPNSNISYKIYDECSLQKKDEMERVFDIIENLTILNFYPLNYKEEISVDCEETENEMREMEGEMFIAGEGGATKIIAGDKFNVIFNGKVLLLRDSECETPNIAMHELLHALGFDHSSNPNNIMYNVTKCKQSISEDISKLINELYSFPSYPDLNFVNVSAKMNGRYLDVNMTIKNNGLKDSGEFNVEIYADEKPVKELDSEPIKIGEGRIIILGNIFVNKINVDELQFIINSNFNELEKENNKIKLEIRKS